MNPSTRYADELRRNDGNGNEPVDMAGAGWAWGMPLSYVLETACRQLSLYDRAAQLTLFIGGSEPAPGGGSK